jgi:hypothetical protein
MNMPTEEILRSLHSYIYHSHCNIGRTYNEELGLYLYDIYVDMSKAYNALSSTEKLCVEDLNRKRSSPGVRVGQIATALKIKKITKLECAILDIAIIISNNGNELNRLPSDLRKLGVPEGLKGNLGNLCEMEDVSADEKDVKYINIYEFSGKKDGDVYIHEFNGKTYKLYVKNLDDLNNYEWVHYGFKFIHEILKENKESLGRNIRGKDLVKLTNKTLGKIWRTQQRFRPS